MNVTTDTRRTVWICALLSAVTVAIYWPVTGCKFINFDDPLYVTSNVHVMKGLNWGNVAWAFRTSLGGNWHPLTWLSHVLDCSFSA